MTYIGTQALRSISLALCVGGMAISVAPAFAILGETEAELTKQYGKPYEVELDRNTVAPFDKYLRFQANGYRVSVAFLNGKSAIEQYTYEKPLKDSADPRLQSLVRSTARGGKIMPAPDPKLLGDDFKWVWVLLHSSGDATVAVREENLNRIECQTNEATKLLMDH